MGQILEALFYSRPNIHILVGEVWQSLNSSVLLRLPFFWQRDDQNAFQEYFG